MARLAVAPILSLALAASSQAAAAVPNPADYVEFRWYRIEAIVFARSDPASDSAAPQELLAGLRLPRAAVPLVAEPSRGGTSGGSLVFGPALRVDDRPATLFSNLPPPAWLADCATAAWTPAHDVCEAGVAIDPCLLALREVGLQGPWPGIADLDAATWLTEDTTEDGETAAPGLDPLFPAPGVLPQDEHFEPADGAPAVDEPFAQTDTDQALREALQQAVRDWEQSLLDSGRDWQPRPPGLAAELRRVRSRFNVVAAGAWHQHLPPRERPQPKLVQLGEMNATRRFPIEGWFSVTVARYVHFEAVLAVELPDGTALFSERRRMRSGELHYLDHPALGILVRIEPVELPAEALLAEAEQAVWAAP